MTTLSYPVADSATMLRRQLRHIIRYPSMTVQLVGLPIFMLLLFVYVFGGTLGDGLGGADGGRTAYVNYVVPGIVLMAVALASTGTAIGVAMDMTEGIVARFKTMAIFRPSVLAGHVFASMLQSMFSVAVVIGVGLLIGFRPDASAVEWLAAAGVLGMIMLALTWLTVAFGMVSKTVESASNLPTPLVFLPFLGSGFVPTESMPGWMQWFADYQPFTPVIETVRGLLMGTEIGNNAVLAIAWSVGLTILGYVWAKARYNRGTAG